MMQKDKALLNTFYASDVSRPHVKKLDFPPKKIKILEFGDYIWNHHEICIQISTNIPGIGLGIREILTILRNKSILYGW